MQEAYFKKCKIALFFVRKVDIKILPVQYYIYLETNNPEMILPLTIVVFCLCTLKFGVPNLPLSMV